LRTRPNDDAVVADTFDRTIVLGLCERRSRSTRLCTGLLLRERPSRTAVIDRHRPRLRRQRLAGPDVVPDVERSYEPTGHSQSSTQTGLYRDSVARVPVTIVGRAPGRLTRPRPFVNWFGRDLP